AAEMEAFPEYYEQYMRQAMLGGSVAPVTPLVCTGPVIYRGQEAVMRDIENLKAAFHGLHAEDVFMPSIAPSGVGSNEYYRTEEVYFYAVGDAMRHEYQAIVNAGFVLQIDDPFLTEIFSRSSMNHTERRNAAEMWVEALNYAISGIREEKVRFHTCYG